MLRIAILAVAALETQVTERWVARFNRPFGGDHEARALAMDSFGNLYVTGSSWAGTTTRQDYATVSYDPAGNRRWVAIYDGPVHLTDIAHAIAVDGGTGAEQWVARYDGPVSGPDSAASIAVDSLGNIYVTGYSDGGPTWLDYTTVSYDGAGNERWVARYTSPGMAPDYAATVLVSASGNVYVTGSWFGAYEYATVAYSQP